MPAIRIIVSFIIKKGLEGRKNKIHFFSLNQVFKTWGTVPFVNKVSKKFIAKELYYCYNLSCTLVSCIVIYILIFKLRKKSVLKLKNKRLTYSTHVYNFTVLKIFLGRHTPETIFLAAQNCFGLVSKVPLPLQISRNTLETQAWQSHIVRVFTCSFAQTYGIGSQTYQQSRNARYYKEPGRFRFSEKHADLDTYIVITRDVAITRSHCLDRTSA